jgi:NAD(P)H-quinone oxidoreductase subunit 4
MRPRELLIGLTLLVPTLVIGFWPRVAIDFYEASTNALSTQLLAGVSVAAGRFTPFA